MSDQPPKNRAPLDRGDWIHAGIDTLAEEGIEGVRVEVLAKRCGVTKGSFYWHFKDRRDLLDAMLDEWKVGRIRDIIKQTTAEPGHELEQIYHVIDVYSASRNQKGIKIELAVRDWARKDPHAAAVVEEVDATRFERARQLFLDRGLPLETSSTRSMLIYAYVFGQSLMNCDRFGVDLPAAKSAIADLIAK